ncbi:hypothetical protein [Corynebacterium argentoratense]
MEQQEEDLTTGVGVRRNGRGNMGTTHAVALHVRVVRARIHLLQKSSMLKV